MVPAMAMATPRHRDGTGRGRGRQQQQAGRQAGKVGERVSVPCPCKKRNATPGWEHCSRTGVAVCSVSIQGIGAEPVGMKNSKVSNSQKCCD